MTSERFCVHHIGGRSGSRGFPLIKGFENLVTSVMYDADIDCIEQIVERASHSKSETLVFPFAFSEKEGISKLYITYDPNMSSLLKPLPDTQINYSYPKSNFDYDVNQALKIVEERLIDVISLDQLLKNKPEIPKPIFLSIDTQGSELKILKGAIDTLDNVVAVLVEVAFVPLYENHPLFGEVNEFLNRAGFVLMDIYKGVPTSNSRGPVGTRAKGQLSWGDALYFKNPHNADRSALAFTALAFGYSDFARDCLPIQNFLNPKLEEILKKFEQITINCSQKLPLSLNEIYSEIESRERYYSKKSPIKINKLENIKNKIKDKEKSLRVLFIFYKFIKIIKVQIKNTQKILIKRHKTRQLRKFATNYGFNNLHLELTKNIKN